MSAWAHCRTCDMPLRSAKDDDDNGYCFAHRDRPGDRPLGVIGSKQLLANIVEQYSYKDSDVIADELLALLQQEKKEAEGLGRINGKIEVIKVLIRDGLVYEQYIPKLEARLKELKASL